MQNPESQTADKQRLRSVITLAIFVLFLLSIFLVARATGWDESLSAMGRLSASQIAILLGLSLLNYGLRSLRWHSYTQALSLPTGFGQNARHYMAGFALTATPGRLGELIRLRWIWLETGYKPNQTGALVLIDRAADLAAVGLLLGGAVLASPTEIIGAWYVAIVAVFLAILATNPGLVRLAVTWGWKITGIFPRLFATIRHAAGTLEIFARVQISARTTSLGVLGWCAEAFAFFLLLGWLGADVSLPLAFAVFFFAMLSGGASGLPGGIGGAEAGMIAALTLHGVPLEIALPATAVIRITTLWFAILIGILILPAVERLATQQGPKPTNALEPTNL